MMDVRNIFKVALAVLILPVGLDSYANGQGSTSCITGYGAYMNADNYGYSSGQNNQHNDSNCRNYRNYKNRGNTKGINHSGGKPKSSNKSVVNEVVVKGHNYAQSRNKIKLAMGNYKQENQVAMLGAFKAWGGRYITKAKKFFLKEGYKIVDNCRQNASSDQTFREVRVGNLYKSGKLNRKTDIKSVVQWKNGVGIYEYMENVHHSIRVVEKSFKWEHKGEGCKAIKNNTHNGIASRSRYQSFAYRRPAYTY